MESEPWNRHSSLAPSWPTLSEIMKDSPLMWADKWRKPFFNLIQWKDVALFRHMYRKERGTHDFLFRNPCEYVHVVLANAVRSHTHLSNMKRAGTSRHKHPHMTHSGPWIARALSSNRTEKVVVHLFLSTLLWWTTLHHFDLVLFNQLKKVKFLVVILHVLKHQWQFKVFNKCEYFWTKKSVLVLFLSPAL